MCLLLQEMSDVLDVVCVFRGFVLSFNKWSHISEIVWKQFEKKNNNNNKKKTLNK